MRDFHSEIIQTARDLPSGTRLADEAEAIVGRFEKDDDWTTWVDEHITAYVHDVMRSVLRSERAKATHNVDRERFAESVMTGGSYEPRYAVDTEGTWKRLSDMNRDDLHYAASQYQNQANSAALHAAFLEALARRVGNKTVGEVLSAQQIERVRQAAYGKAA